MPVDCSMVICEPPVRTAALTLTPMLGSRKATLEKVETNMPLRKLMAVAPRGRLWKVMLEMDRPVKKPPLPRASMLRP